LLALPSQFPFGTCDYDKLTGLRSTDEQVTEEVDDNEFGLVSASLC